MPKERDAASPAPDRPAEPSSDERQDRIKALIFFFGVIALMIVVKLLMGN